MPDFALYFVPPADDPLYRIGSDVLGYDVRTGLLLPEQNSARSAFQQFTSGWVQNAQTYGFHMTISHALEFEAEKLGAIEAETASILNLFDPAKPYVLTPCTGDAYIATAPHWACLLRYDGNLSFLMLHALVVSRLNPLSSGTPQLRRYQAGEITPARHGQHRITQYFHDTILDDFYPHFTLFNPLPVDDVEPVRASVMATVPEPQPITIKSLCLLVRQDGESHFRIHREFMLADYPQAITPSHTT
ncbi:MAG: hypothetical protein R3E39_29205 [Anaerolineae bacterium]